MSPRSPEVHQPPGVSRRGFLTGVLAVAAGYMASEVDLVGKGIDYFTNQDESTPESAQDVLTNPDEFTAFVNEYKDIAQELAKDSDKPMPYEVFLAVGIHESDSGTSELAVEANNLFGIVAKDGWTGDIYEKATNEEVATADIARLKREHPELKVEHDFGDGRSSVNYKRPFRAYDTPKDSFRDFRDKLYYKKEDGSYRYSDVVSYLKDGGRDPSRVAYLMSDTDQPDEARWATGREWIGGVTNYITVIQKLTGQKSAESKTPEDKKLPDTKEHVDVDAIDFSELDQPRDAALVETMKKAFAAVNLKDYAKFDKKGITDASGRVQRLLNDPAYYNRKFRADVKPEFLVLHLWANGVDITKTTNPNLVPKGSSHRATLSDQVQSWKNSGRGASAAYLLSDNPSGDLWQLTTGEFGAAIMSAMVFKTKVPTLIRESTTVILSH